MRPHHWHVLTLTLALLVYPHLSARSSKAESYWRQAQKAEEAGEYERALELYETALQKDPGNAAYLMGARRVRVQLSQVITKAGQQYRAQGQLQKAAAELRKAFTTDPSNVLALQELQRTTEMIERNNTGHINPGEERFVARSDRIAKSDAADRIDGADAGVEAHRQPNLYTEDE